MRNSIPLLGVPVLNRGDLLKRLINSIDFPIDKLVVVNNGNDSGVANTLKYVQNGGNENIRKVDVIKPLKNLGVGPSWNTIIKLNSEVPYWMICGNDMMLKEKGDLQKIFEFTESHFDHDMLLGAGYSWFTMFSRGLDKAGYFDENIFPAYMEDVDHHRRLILSNAKVKKYTVKLIHGEAPNWGSHTIHFNSKFLKANSKTHHMNNAYYAKKWGGLPGREIFSTPFGNPNLPVTFWYLDKDDRAAREKCWQ